MRGMARTPDGRLKRWLILVGYWVVQAVVLVAAGVFFYGSTGGGEWEFRPAGEYFAAVWDDDLLPIIAVCVPLLTGLQFLLVMPVHLRLLRRRRGKSVHAAMAAAAVLMALLVVAFVAAASELFALYDIVEDAEWSGPAILVGLGLSWTVFTLLLLRYSRRSTLANADLLTRVARLVFAGTVIETAALIPIDVMVRRKTECYCWAGSLIALMLSGAIGLIVAGPAVFLPLMARRPVWLRAGRCERCGYDRAGLGPEVVCPECGGAPEDCADPSEPRA